MGALSRDGKLGRFRGDDIVARPEIMSTILPGREEGERCSGRGLELGTMSSLVGLKEGHW